MADLLPLKGERNILFQEYFLIKTEGKIVENLSVLIDGCKGQL